MHTSKLLKSSDFQYWQLTDDSRISVDFGTFCPDYHELDRVGVISPCFEDGILHTGDALLALTTAFYDVLRSQGTDFFDYPQHFAFIGASGDVIHTRDERIPIDQIGTGWGNLGCLARFKVDYNTKKRYRDAEEGFRFSDKSTVLATRFQTGIGRNPTPCLCT